MLQQKTTLPRIYGQHKLALLGEVVVVAVVEEEAVKKDTKLQWQGRSCLWEEWKRGEYGGREVNKIKMHCVNF